MGPNDGLRMTELRIGDVRLNVRNEALQKCPPGSTLSAYVKQLRKGKDSTYADERDGRSFAYIIHYLATGDLVYPLHEGFHRVDILLKELAFFGLVEDVLRSAKQEGNNSRLRSRRSDSFFSVATHPHGPGATQQRRPSVQAELRPAYPLSKSVSLNNVLNESFVQQRPLHSISMNNLDLESQVKGQQETRSSRTRFLSFVKRYLSLKTPPRVFQPSPRTSPPAPQWSPAGSGGVFRPTSANGSTLVLAAEPDCVTVFGLRSELCSIFPDADVLGLRTTSSAFIDAQTTLYPEDLLDNDSPKIRSGADWLSLIHRKYIHKYGFVVTVQSQWKNSETLNVHHQWILHRKWQNRNNGSRRPSHGSPVPVTSLGRRTSILHRLFQKNVEID